MRGIFRFLALLSIVASIVVLPPAHSVPAAPAVIPAPLPNAPLPTIQISAAGGYVGQRIDVAGKGVAGTPGVRVTWLYGATTLTAAVVNTTPTNDYSATAIVPAGVPPGPVKICAAATGSATAAFACADFSITRPPLGTVQGRIPFPTQTSNTGLPAINATFVLFDRSGATIASAPIAANGAFSLANVPPGRYNSAVIGALPQIVATQPVLVTPGGESSATAAFLPPLQEQIDPVTQAACSSGTAIAAQVSADPSDRSARLFDQAAFGSAIYPPPAPQTTGETDNDFGLYVSGAALDVTFATHLQTTGAPVERVEYHVRQGAAPPIALGAASPGNIWQISYNIGQLAPGRYTLFVAPVVGGARQCPATRSINVIADPIRGATFQSGAQTVWNAEAQHYEFQGTLPNSSGLLPLIYPAPPPDLQLIGAMENTLDASLRVEGSLRLKGAVSLRVLQMQGTARLFNRELFGQARNLIPPGAHETLFDLAVAQRTGIPFGPTRLAAFAVETPVFRGAEASFWGLTNINTSLSVGLNGDLTLSGVIQPLEAGFDATMRANISARPTVTIWVDMLLGVAAAGADTSAQVALDLPLRLNTAGDPPVELANPCLDIAISLSPWARVNRFFTQKSWNAGTTELLTYRAGCAQRAAPSAPPPPPRVMAAPAIAGSPDGQALLVYVEDTTPDAPTPTAQVMARFRDTGSSQWNPPTPLSDGAHMAQDPVVAFAGPNHTPIVAWIEAPLTPEEENAAGDDLNAILQRQELFVTTFSNGVWSAPARLTGDALADGRPALAGDLTGATLAWVRDTGGNVLNRANLRIAVLEWKPDSGWEQQARLLNGSPSGESVMNAQVSVARTSVQNPFGGPPVSRRMLAWTVDADGDLNTSRDRRVVVYNWNGQDWAALAPQLTPPANSGADSPSIALDPQTLQPRLAFLVRGQDGNGVNDTGIGNRALVFAGKRTADGWTFAPIRDEQQQPVYGEQPRLTIGSGGEDLLLFRRFGQVGTHGELGQLALARAVSGGAYSAPLYLTDEPRQNWQPAMTINPQSKDVLIVTVGRPATGGVAGSRFATPQLARATAAPLPTLRAATLTSDNNSVASFAVGASADPALDPLLHVSQTRAAPGSTVVISATLRNLGRAPAGALKVSFYNGEPGSGALIQEVAVPGTLNFNEARVVAIPVTVGNSVQPISAVAAAAGADAAVANNVARTALGALPPPAMARVAISLRYDNALDIAWAPLELPGVAGYRVLRSATTGGPYELVGETTGATFADLPLQRGTTYYYVVQTYDSNGAVSTNSQELSGSLPPEQMYLPLVRR